MRSIGIVMMLGAAACANHQSDLTSELASCRLDQADAACNAPTRPLAAAPSFDTAPAIETGITYEVTTPTPDAIGYLSFTPPTTGSYTLYFDTSEPIHVCDVILQHPTCESSFDTCPTLDDARAYPMVQGVAEEIWIPPSATPFPIHIEPPLPTTHAPHITFTTAPLDGGTSGPHVTINLLIDGGTALDCRIDNTPGPCPDQGLETPPIESTLILNAGTHTYQARAIDSEGNIAVATRTWTVLCFPPSSDGAIGLLHLDDGSGQLASNGAGGAAGILGDTTAIETSDPAWLSKGRFGGALSFTSSDGDHVTWPTELGSLSTFAMELWFQPEQPALDEDLFATGDGKLVIRTLADSGVDQIAVEILDDYGGIEEQRVSAFTPGTWHYLSVSYDGHMLNILSDGAGYAKAITGGLASVAFDSIRLGGDGANAYGGTIDEVWLSPTPIGDYFKELDRYCPLTSPY